MLIAISLVVLVLGQKIACNPVRNVRDIAFSKLGEFPFMVSLRNTDHICSGTIINKDWILTTAHCIQNENIFSISIHYGATVRDSYDEEITSASDFIIHPDWDEDTIENDIALIKLDTSLVFDELVQPIELVPAKCTVPAGTDAIQVGWFSMVKGKTSKNRLQKIDLTTISDKKCSDFYETDIRRKLICAKTFTKGKSCFGSGAPLIVDNYQVGVLSFGNGQCSKLSEPIAFTEVSYYVKWISETIEEYEYRTQEYSSEDSSEEFNNLFHRILEEMFPEY